MEEKVEIAKKYLIPRNRTNMGLKESNPSFSIAALKQIINGYARESGVRNLENLIKKILRKVAIKIVREDEKKVKVKKPQEYKIDEKDLKEYLGKPVFTSDRYFKKTPVGVSMGLAWTALGGATLYVEAIKMHAEKTQMKLTGQAGDVMKESSQIAWNYTHSALEKLAPDIPFFKGYEVHLHIPEGATPKDGPSAGITMATALFSLLLNQPILEDLGMTGELTLTGKILPIGGVKEKVIAAKRSGLNKLIFPKENQKDYDELPAYIKKGFKKVYFVDHYEEVFHVAFGKK